MSGALRRTNHSRSSGGFTVIEVMIVMAISLIVMGIAAPAFSSIIAAQRVKSTGTEIYLSLVRARSEAIKRNANVTLAPKQGGWQNGWTVADSADPTNILDDHGPVPSLSIMGPISFVYRASGRPQPGTIVPTVVSTSAGSTAYHQCVSVGLSGHPFLKKGISC